MWFTVITVHTVESDQRDNERRANMVFISGLMQHNDRTGADCIQQLTMLELGVDLQVR